MIAPIFLFPLPSLERIKVRGCFPSLPADRSEESLPLHWAARTAPLTRPCCHSEQSEESPVPALTAHPLALALPPAPLPPLCKPRQTPPNPPHPSNEHLSAKGAFRGSFGGIRVRALLAASGSAPLRLRGFAPDGAAAADAARVPTSGFTRPPDMGSGRRPGSARRPAQPCGLAAPWL